jgi:hypothetical protein
MTAASIAPAFLARLSPPDFAAVAREGCYVYAYLRKATGTPYYIGAASNARRPKDPHKVRVPEDRARIRILRSGLSWDDALRVEARYIAHYGRTLDGSGVLRNYRLGGQQGLGHRASEEARRKMSLARRGVAKTPEHRAKIAESNRITKGTPEAKQRARDAGLRRDPPSEAARQQTAATLRQRHLDKLAALGHTEESWADLDRERRRLRKRDRDARARAAVTPEERARREEDRRAKISAAKTQFYCDPRQRQLQGERTRQARARIRQTLACP